MFSKYVCLQVRPDHGGILIIVYCKVEAEDQADIAESFDVESVPAFVILRGHTLLARVSGADAEALTSAIATHTRPSNSSAPKSSTSLPPQKAPVAPAVETPEELEKRMRGLMAQSKIVLFMKGSPDHPQCGFSRRTVALLRDHKYEFTHFDILSDDSVRAGMSVVHDLIKQQLIQFILGLKKLNNWPTFPQVIVGGELVGGLDIVTEMMENGEFAEVAA